MDVLSFAAVALVFTVYSQQSHDHKEELGLELELELELDHAEREQMHVLSRDWDYPPNLEKFVRWSPKVELHVHFDGSWDPTMIYQHLRENGTIELLPQVSILPWDQSEYPVRQLVENCQNKVDFHSLCSCRGKRSLHDMLKAFEVFLPLVRGNLELLESLAVDFVKRQAQQNVVYTEMRYSPHLLAQGGSLQQTQTSNEVNADPVVDAITRGLRRGEAEYGVQVNQILCCITWRPDWADDVVRLAFERRVDTPCAVVGIDIAAGEEHFDVSHPSHLPHKRAMHRASFLGIPITLHAGEVSGDASIQMALEFGARRIGHGYRMSPQMMQKCKTRGIHVEICPTTSVETGGWQYGETKKDWRNHPAVNMMKHGLCISLNSDDPSVFDTSLTWQWRIALGKMGFLIKEIENMTRNAIRASFLPDHEKESLFKMTVQGHTPCLPPKLLQRHSFSDRVSGETQVRMEHC
jgi:adenosine deaminase